MDILAEEWRDIPVLEGYQASNLGRIKAVARQIWIKRNGGKYAWLRVRERIAKLQIRHHGYLQITRRRKSFDVHVLVARAWIGERPHGMTINHKDGNKQNNRVFNLEYVSQKFNVHHALTNGLLKTKLSHEDAKHIRMLSTTMSQVEIANKYGIVQSHVSRIVNNQRWR